MRRGLRVFGPAILVLVALAALLVGLAVGGGASAPLHHDPGAGVRWGLPIARLLVDLGAAGMLGSLCLAVFALREPSADAAAAAPASAPVGATEAEPAGASTAASASASASAPAPASASAPASAPVPAPRPAPARPRTERDVVMDLAAASAALLTVAAAATGFLSYADSTGQPISGAPEFGDGLGSFLTSVALGRSWVAVTVMAALATAFCFAARGRAATILLTLFGVGTLIPLALQGDLTGTPGQGLAITSLGLHLVFAAVWVGGLVALVVVHRMLDDERLPVVVARYSTIALFCFVAVGGSGVIVAGLRLDSFAGLATGYGMLVIVKAAALVLLGVGGLLHRRRLVRRMRGAGGPARPGAAASGAAASGTDAASRPATPPPARRGPFRALVLGELALLGIASGIATALTRTTSPAEVHAASATPGTSPADILTGHPLPPPADLARLAGGIHLEPIWLLVVGFGAFFYLAGVWRMRRSGRAWPLARTVVWLLGLAVLLYVTGGGLAVYRVTLFSAQLTVFATTALLVPVLLASALPVTLAVHSIRPRTDGSGGPREWILALINARTLAPLARPWITGGLLIASLWAWLATRVMDWSVADPVGYHLCLAWMLVTGYLFAQSVIARDPLPYRAAYPVRIIVLVAVGIAHLVIGIVIGVRQGLWMADWFGAMGRTWGLGAIADQNLGGWITLALGMLGTLILLVAVARQWAAAARRSRMPAAGAGRGAEPGAGQGAGPGTGPGTGPGDRAAAADRIRSAGDGDGE